MPNLRQSGSIVVTASVLLGSLFISASAHSQGGRSQRRLPTGLEAATPIDQIRLLLRLQQLIQSKSPSSGQLPGDLITNGGKLQKLAESLVQMNQQTRNSLPRADNQAQSNQPRKLSNRQRLEEELRAPAAELNAPTDRAPPVKSNRRTRPLPRQIDGSRSDEAQEASSQRRPAAAEFPAGQRSGNESPGHSWKNSPGSDFLQRDSESVRRDASRQQRRIGEASTSTDDSSFDIGRELSSRGLEQTFRRLIRDVRKNVQHDARTDAGTSQATPTNSMWNQALANVLDTVRDDVVEMVRDSTNSRTEHSPENHRLSKMQEDSRANSVEQPIVSRSHDGSSPAVTASSSRDPAVDLPPTALENTLKQRSLLADDDVLQLILILSGLSIAALAFRAVTRRATLAQHGQRIRTLATVTPEQIQTPADVIRAFHWLTHCQSPDAAEWWNHRQAETWILQQSPGLDQSLHHLTQLYEAARYQPGDGAFDETRIQQARVALDRCLS